MKFAKDIGEGARQVLDMERAFDKLNTRLKLSTKQMQEFKTAMGRGAAKTGQKLEDILPGVEVAAARGGIKSPEELTVVGEALAKAKATTGEGTENLSEVIVQILKDQGKKITGETFKQTLDALQGARTAGTFKTAGEAGQSVLGISGVGKQLGLGTREMGGLSATASKSGAGGQAILEKLLDAATKIGGAARLNATLGQKIFKEGAQGQAVGMDVSKLGKVNMKSPQIMEAITGLTGAAGGDLKRFVDAFKEGMGSFNEVITGANETSSQFESATDNLASKIDRFKESTKEAGREVGESLATMIKHLAEGNIKSLGGDIANVGKKVYENKGTILAAGALTAGVGVLMGGGIRGLSGMAGGVAMGQAAKAAGITPVYVTNASEIGTSMGGLPGGLTDKLGKFGKIGGAMAGSVGAAGVGAIVMTAGAGLAIGGAIGTALNSNTTTRKALDKTADYIFDAIQGGEASNMKKYERAAMGGILEKKGQKFASSEERETAITKAMEKVEKAIKEQHAGRPLQVTNPSSVKGRVRH
jgi:hypothetical protein